MFQQNTYSECFPRFYILGVAIQPQLNRTEVCVCVCGGGGGGRGGGENNPLRHENRCVSKEIERENELLKAIKAKVYQPNRNK